MAISNILNKVSSVGNIVNSTVNKLGGLFTSDDYTPSSIRDKYTNGFYGDTTHFRPSVFARLFDEPTYLTFRIVFNFGYNFRNDASSGMEYSFSYDYLPEPLLDTSEKGYSTYNYLRDVLGETKRAALLKQFINELKDIQTNYPYYFTKLSGLNNLTKIDTKSGIRIKDDATIEIECYDAIDLKITQLMQLYRKIAWDDVYQRWILPDMMRLFNFKIYVSEIRLFHDMSESISSPKYGRVFDFKSGTTEMSNATSYDQISDSNILGSINNVLNSASALSERVFGSSSKVAKVLNTANQITDTASEIISGLNNSIVRLCNNAINDVMPTICFDCHMCQFMIDDTLSSIDSLKSNKPDMLSSKIRISVGQVLETQSYPLNIGLSKNGHSYQITGESYLSASSYINDDVLQREATWNAEKMDVSIEKELRINNPMNRINEQLSYTDGSEDSYQIFNSNAATSANALLTSICNKFQKSETLSTATNTSSDEAKQQLKQVTQQTSSNNKLITTYIDSSTKSKKLIDDIDNIPYSLATNKDISKETFEQIKDLYKNYSLSEISTATSVISEIQNLITNSKQIDDLSQIDEVSNQLKSNAMTSILTEIVNTNKDENANQALVQLAQIMLDDSKNFSPATSEENRSKLTGFSLLN